MSDPKLILLAEDDFDLHSSLKHLLEMQGYRIFSAYNGLEALEILTSSVKPTWVLLDLMMPVMNGYELLEELRKRGKVASTPVIVVSAAADAQATAEEFGLKFIPKPINFVELIKTLSSEPNSTSQHP